MAKFNSKNRGYSLIEIIIYIGIFALISVVVVNSFIHSVSASKTAFAKRNLLETGNSAMERMTREIRLADTIIDANSVFDTGSGILEISSVPPTGGTRVIKFKIDSGVVNMYEGGTLYGSVSGSQAVVSTLIFRKITTAQGKAIKIEMTVTDSLGYTSNFYNTVGLRGVY